MNGVDADGVGAMRIDLATARQVLARIGAVKARVRGLVEAGTELDRPLRFGDSWVAQLAAGQLRDAGVERDGGLTPALRTFHQVLDDLEAVVRFSAGEYQRIDEDAVARLRGAIEGAR